MSFRRVLLQFWACVTLAWLAGCGIMAVSGLLEAQLMDQVRFQQHARDVSAVGLNPVSRTHADGMAPLLQNASTYWAREGGRFVRMAVLPPLGLLAVPVIGWMIVPRRRTRPAPARAVRARLVPAAG